MLGFQIAGLTILVVMFIGSPSEARSRSRLTHCKGDNCIIGNMEMKEEQVIVPKKMLKIEGHPLTSGPARVINGVEVNAPNKTKVNDKVEEVEKKDDPCDESHWTFEKVGNDLTREQRDLLMKHECWNILCNKRFWPNGPNARVVGRTHNQKWAQDHCK